MGTQTQPSPAPGTLRIKPAQVIMTLVLLVMLPAVILFGAAGRLGWIAGWTYVIVVGGISILSRAAVILLRPELAVERSRAYEHPGAKAWDRYLMTLVGLIGPMVVLLVAGLDERNGWSGPVAPGLQIGALVVILLGMLIGLWAMFSNPFFSATIRIQTDRGHTVVNRGPYRLVRHPSYGSGLFVYLAVPVLLGSWWGLLPAVLGVILLIYRTVLEDRTLHEELDGYVAYAARVRYRLIPGVW
jgi:protein-S-isoprenylcysteine O-methyltransferase Ste14